MTPEQTLQVALEEEESLAWGALTGERVHMTERLVVSPCSGRLALPDDHEGVAIGEYVREGHTVGFVSEPNGHRIPILSPFSGWLMGFLLPPGSPVRTAEPVVWLRGS